MEDNKWESKKITSRSDDYSQWYSDVIDVAELAEHGPSKGSMIIRPYGYSLWESIQTELNRRFRKIGVKNAYFPLLIPERFLKKEEEHVEGFMPEVAVVTYAGGKKLEEAYVIRPTSETIIYDAFSRWISSRRDLPLLINQWANVVRWELRPRLFIRTTEFLWQEGHTAHATLEEADEFARNMLHIYEEFSKDFMAIPVIAGIKPNFEKFAGALHTYSIEAMMQDGKALQFATSHNLGHNFAKVFNVQFTSEDGTAQDVAQTSWGLSTRTIGGMVMVHSDDKGLVLPPKIAPVQVVILLIAQTEEIKKKIKGYAEKIALNIKQVGVDSIIIDDGDERIGAKHYHWEKKGVPIRVEVGPKDLEKESLVLVRRDTGDKLVVNMFEVGLRVISTLDDIQLDLYEKAKKRMDNKTVRVDNWDDFVKNIELGNFILAHWSGTDSVAQKIKEETGATIRCIPFSEPEESGKCVYSKEVSLKRVLFAKSY